MSPFRKTSRAIPRLGTSLTILAGLAGIVAALELAGCREGVVSAAQPKRIQEAEPDDSSSQANWGGLLVPGSRRVVEGHVSSVGADVRDGFSFTAAEPCSLRFRLVPSLPGADLDLLVCDPRADEFTGCFDGTDSVEEGEIALPEAGEIVDLVICSAWASSGYSLEIEAGPLRAGGLDARPCEGKRTLEKHSGYLRRNEPASIASTVPVRPVLAFTPASQHRIPRSFPMMIGAVGASASFPPEFVSGFGATRH